MYVYYNPNPLGKNTGDCTARSVSKLLDMTWEEASLALCLQAIRIGETEEAPATYGALLKSKGYIREVVPNTCPDCYSVRDFVEDHPQGRFALATGSHVIAAIDGSYYDSWDSGSECPVYYWRKDG